MIEGLRDFVTCLRLHAFARGEADCTASRILSVISKDPRNLEIFNKTTDVQECFVGENLVNVMTLSENLVNVMTLSENLVNIMTLSENLVNVMTLSFRIDRYGQTDQTDIKALLMSGC